MTDVLEPLADLHLALVRAEERARAAQDRATAAALKQERDALKREITRLRRDAHGAWQAQAARLTETCRAAQAALDGVLRDLARDQGKIRRLASALGAVQTFLALLRQAAP